MLDLCLGLPMQAAKQRDAAKRKREREEKAKEKRAAKKAKAGGSKAAKATPAKAAKVRRACARVVHRSEMFDKRNRLHNHATLQAEVQQLVASVLQTATKKRKQREEGACACL